MKVLLQRVDQELKSLGYRRKGNNFWKIENDFYRVINFQRGLYGQYYFINIGIHPHGMPKLVSNELLILEQPKEHECIIRQRVEQVVKNIEMRVFEEGLVSIENERAADYFIESMPEIEEWILKYGTYEGIIGKTEDDMYSLLNVSPIAKRKEFALLQVFCKIKLRDKDGANEALVKYKAEKVNGLNFRKIDNYLVSLIDCIT
ncbi:DUF4304 domain-containing protein [Alicyclobacillus sp. SO9]|uniref:DUF4304 domain-containing protein n=1 Tax=Alicyclobacillus sp. SO9 TaxID=2665646 RepID=UPI0018E8BB2F|nr:DUF4304 domain-containing protein [Alicyclobacillus sp. SO9]QQE80614.1 DUF4304 domain-containing protein [Alicyclobacillus sp. SO9]